MRIKVLIVMYKHIQKPKPVYFEKQIITIT